MSWEHLTQKAVDRIIDAGPTAVTLLLIIISICVVVFFLGRKALRIVWPWLTGTASKALEEAKLSREQRAVELASDAKDKADLHTSFRQAVDTGRLVAEEVKALRETSDRHRADVVTHLRRIDGKAETIQRDVRRLVAPARHSLVRDKDDEELGDEGS